MNDKEKMNLHINTEAIKQVFVNFLIPLIALTLTALLGFVVIYPSIKALPALKAEAAEKATLEAQLSTKVSKLNALVEFKSVVDENVSLVGNVLVSESLVPQLLTQIDQIARESGLAVDKLSYSFSEAPIAPEVAAGGAAPSYSKVNVTLGVIGNYNQLTAFANTLENAARLVDISNLRYNMNEDRDESQLLITLTLQSPYLFVESNAVTDDPVELDISSDDFVKLINKLKALKFYQVSVSSELLNQAVQESSESTESVFSTQ